MATTSIYLVPILYHEHQIYARGFGEESAGISVFLSQIAPEDDGIEWPFIGF
jgi:hypothetical protein